MKKLLTVAAVLLLAPGSLAAQVVGKVDGWQIVKEGDSYRVVLPPKPKEDAKRELTRKKVEKEKIRRRQIYREIVERLKKGEGEPVYSRIKGFDVERVLDAGPFFGAVISGPASPETLKKAFKLVERVGNKYYVVGEWK